MSRAEPILFLGAGFSLGAANRIGQKLPTSLELTEALYAIAFGAAPFEIGTRLPDAFHAARSKDPKRTAELMTARLTVHGESIPEWYRTWFSMPWFRCYTLNLDDLDLAVASRFQLPRSIRSISAPSDLVSGSKDPGALEVIHLNGTVADKIADVTISDIDYARRQTAPDKWLMECSTDILSRPVIFVGTPLVESTLWQYMEFRRTKGSREGKEHRPGSLLVAPTLNVARQAVLRELNVDHVPVGGEQFEQDVLRGLDGPAAEGFVALAAHQNAQERSRFPQRVSSLIAGLKDRDSGYLLGQEPDWPDLVYGRVIDREADEALISNAKGILNGNGVPLLVTGTAGSGKSTALMRLALRLNSDGIDCYWIDERSNFEPYRLRELVVSSEGPLAILVDDSDLWGRYAAGWARDLPGLRPGVLLAAAARSTKVDGLFDPITLAGVTPMEVSMPPLGDADIESLVSLLDRENKLGILKGKNDAERKAAFRNEAGRQLLVAMIQATSGKNFKEKAIEEFAELPDLARRIYASICVVNAQRYSIDRDELLLALDSQDNDTLNAIERLVQRHIIVRKDAQTGYSARHRVIADEVVNGVQNRVALAGSVLEGLCFAFACRVGQELPRTSRNWRRLIRFIDHDFLLRMSSAEIGRAVYKRVEDVLHWDWNYWLHRGSLEVEAGDLDLATYALNTARSISPDERKIGTEYAYLLLKKAAQSPFNSEAEKWFSEGSETLENLIDSRKDDAYPYHVLGSQGLSWARRARLGTMERQTLLHHLLEVVEEGARRLPLDTQLKALADELKREWLSTAVSN